MKPKRIQICSVGILVSCFWFIGISQSFASSQYQSYVKDSYYLGVGGMPPTLDEFASDPRKFLRSEAAYHSLKNGFAELLNRSLSDEEFRSLLASDQVRAERDCVGTIRTAGISATGEVRWSRRTCYLDEKLIEMKVAGRWQVVASQGCFNLVEVENGATPVKSEIEVISGPPPMHSPRVIIQETQGIFVHTCDCPGNHGCHSSMNYLPGYRVHLIR